METSPSLRTLAGRLASFEGPVQISKRRASSAKKKQPSTVSWPHKTPTSLQLARAGFFYKPSANSVDSVTCFLCDKVLDGWEPEDNPTLEHLAHVPECGWAINSGVEMRSQELDRVEEDPLSIKMIEARRSTFHDKWPHELKKGWKCKIDKMVHAGWSYDPLPEAEDCVKCFYCGVCLDGWEPKDDPWDEHQRRSPECHFFSLLEDAKKPMRTARSTNGRASRISKVSRLSMQSTASIAPETDYMSMVDDTASQLDDTILKASGGNSTTGRISRKPGKKTTISKSSRKTSKKHSHMPLDDQEQMHASPNDNKMSVAASSPIREELPASKPRGRRMTKRTTSEAKEEPETFVKSISGDAVHVLSPPKKVVRAKVTRKHRNTNVESSQLQPDHDDHTGVQEAPELVRGAQWKKTFNVGESSKSDHSPAIVNTLLSGPSSREPNSGKKRTIDGVEKKEMASALQSESHRPFAVVIHEEVITSLPAKQRNKGLQKPLPKISDREAPSQMHPLHQEDTSTRVRVPQRQYQGAIASKNKTRQTVDLYMHSEQATGNRATQNEAPSPQQSSDAENRPPVSQLSLAVATEREAPTPCSHVIVQSATPAAFPPKPKWCEEVPLQSSTPWEHVDLETILLDTPSKKHIQHNRDSRTSEPSSMAAALQGLSSAQKQMSVQEWILWNARQAEDGLKDECERLINIFEREGVRALQALEGIECA